MDTIKYKTQGVCSSLIEVKIENNIIKEIKFLDGCSGNLQGISSLCIGMNVNDVINKLKGIRCNNKQTSCPDQLAACLSNYLQSKTYTAEDKNHSKSF